MERLRADVKSLKEKVQSLEVENNKFKGDLEAGISENETLKARVLELEEEVLAAFTMGFDRAVAQIGVVASDVDVSLLDVTKIVSDGRLMDDETLAENQDESVSIEKRAD